MITNFMLSWFLLILKVIFASTKQSVAQETLEVVVYELSPNWFKWSDS